MMQFSKVLPDGRTAQVLPRLYNTQIIVLAHPDALFIDDAW
jgi:hypothetical protein